MKPQTVLVSGATRGLGLAIASGLLQDGYRVLALGRSPSEDFEALQKEVGQERLHFCFCDLNQTETISEAVSKGIATFGEIYGLVNNAAIGLDGILPTMHDTEIVKVMNTNLTAAVILTKYVSRSMLRLGQGRIINISSICAHTGYSGLAAYAASKAGLIGFTKSLARDLGKAKITVNAIAPGFMHTEMTAGLSGQSLEKITRRSALGTLVRPTDIYPTVKLLLSAEARNYTGQTYTVDAGATA